MHLTEAQQVALPLLFLFADFDWLRSHPPLLPSIIGLSYGRQCPWYFLQLKCGKPDIFSPADEQF